MCGDGNAWLQLWAVNKYLSLKVKSFTASEELLRLTAVQCSVDVCHPYLYIMETSIKLRSVKDVAK